VSKFGKFAKILNIGSTVAKPVLPGGVGLVLDIVNGQLAANGPTNAESAVKVLAEDNDEQTKAIYALHERQNELDERLKALEGK
jgi:hypothetical protein